MDIDRFQKNTVLDQLMERKSIRVFTNTPIQPKEKQAIFSVVNGLVLADGKIDTNEVLYHAQLVKVLQPSSADLEAAKTIEVHDSLSVIRSMSDEKKIALGIMMQQMIAADNDVDNKELILFNFVCIQTGIDKLIKNLK